MPNYQTLQNVNNFESLIEYLRDELDWDFQTEDIEDLTFDYEPEELGLDETAAAKIEEIKQIRRLTLNQPWGIFYIDFGRQKPSVTAMRKLLRGLVKRKRESDNDSDRQRFALENLLFILTSENFNRFDFAYFRGLDVARATLSVFGWQTGETHLRTLVEFNLPKLKFPANPNDQESWLKQWREAFDVEKVTDKFFADYKTIFNRVESEVKESIADTEKARLFTQRLFNRLMFIYFLQKKGWLSFDNDKNYLRRLFEESENARENFYTKRLYYLFFFGLSNIGNSAEIHDNEFYQERRGDVPYLNGGLFEREEDEFDGKGAVGLSNERFKEILEMFERYNFTVEESTPLDVEVAVDPEMLGKVFEELVTGRHESGSYYTPRPIVSFMCREAIILYLIKYFDRVSVEMLVYEGNAENLSDPEAVLNALKNVKVCDPACGSGAYLLGMMQELLRLREALFASKKVGDATVYERKREIIENNIYGVDKDRFAVQIASLRLWLSLAIESKDPHPLPNLKYKIGCGDSLLAPLDNDLQIDMFRRGLIEEFRYAKNVYAKTSDPREKHFFESEIKRLRVALAQAFNRLPELPKPERVLLAEREAARLQQTIRRLLDSADKHSALKTQSQLDNLNEEIAVWKQQSVVEHQDKTEVFDWQIEFAEVFGDGGFDIALANPPYIRMELFKPIKPILRQNFPKVHSDRADLYVYFFARANDLLKQNGVGTFISSNQWLKAGYGESLRRLLLDESKFHLVVDFGELPVFKAATFPAIFLWQKAERKETSTKWTVVKDLQACYTEGVREHIERLSETLPPTQFGTGKARLVSAQAGNTRGTMEKSGVRLKEYVEGKIFWGIKTGFNEAFVINRETRDELIAKDEKSAEIIKSLLVGDDVRRYEIHFRESYLIYTPRNIDINRYPAIEKHLLPHRKRLEARATRQEWFELQQPQAAFVPYFNSPKIIYPDIGKDLRFAIDEKSYFSANTAYFIGKSDLYLLAVLNSANAFEYLKGTCATLGDENDGGRLRFFGQYLETLPIPNASDDEREAVAGLAKETQKLHTARRARVEKFLLEVGTSAAQSSSRNPLEQVWAIDESEFLKRTKSRFDTAIFRRAHDETFVLTEQINRIEREIDERVAALYGVNVDKHD